MSVSHLATDVNQTATCARGQPPPIGVEALAESFIEFLGWHIKEKTAIPGKEETVSSETEAVATLLPSQDSTPEGSVQTKRMDAGTLLERKRMNSGANREPK